MTKKQWGAKKRAASGRRALERRVRSLVAYHQTAMGLSAWDIEVKFETIKKAVATNHLNPTTREATLTFDLDQQMTRPARWIEHDVLHELAHCLTARQDRLIRHLWVFIADEVEEAATVDLERMPALTNRR